LREHGVINWSDSSVEIERKVRAYDPWPGTTTLWPMTDGTKKTVKLFPPVQIVSGEGEPGSILEAGASGLVVACGNGALRFQSLQLEGKRRMTISELITGNAFPEKLG
jgi:methionyl-tRNA formyltransferase